MYLLVKPGPRVYFVRWKYSKKKGRGKYKRKDVTSKFSREMFMYPCKLHKDVRLLDILKLLDMRLDFYDSLFGCWAKEIVTEGLSQNPPEEDREIAYLELSWIAEVDEKDGLTGVLFPSFFGVGHKPEEVRYGVSFSPVYEIAGLPLKLGGYAAYSTEGPITDREIVSANKAQFTLQQILYGVLYELSWNGGPMHRNKRMNALLSARDEVINGTNNEP